jgi:prephenate dehydrogenase
MRDMKSLKVLIVGLGQIGGSIGYDLVADQIVAEVIGYDKNPEISRRAVDLNIIHRAAVSLKSEIPLVDLVILTAPIRQIIDLIPLICSAIDASGAVLDMAGTKMAIFDAVARSGRAVHYIGGHPLAGNEKRGLEAAARHKFYNRIVTLTPFDRKNDEEWFYTVMHLVTRLGARPLSISAEEHDRLIALTSHLPYALALSLMGMAADLRGKNNNFQHLIGGSFHGATRVAASAPDLTLDMFLTNRKNIATALDEMIDRLSRLKSMIQSGDEASLMELINSARRDHNSFTG